MKKLLLANIPISIQLTLAIFTASMVMLIATAMMFTYWQSRQARDQSISIANTALSVMAQDFVRSIVLGTPDMPADIAAKLEAFPAIAHATFYDKDKTPTLVYSRKGYTPLTMKMVKTPEKLKEDDFATISLPITYMGSKHGEAIFHIDLGRYKQHLNAVLKKQLTLVPFLLLISFAVSFLFQRYFTGPIKYLAQILATVRDSQELNIDENKASSSEMKMLLSGFNSMGDRIKLTQSRLAEQKERLLVTLESIADGVIATDKFGNINYINPAAEKITGWNEADSMKKPADSVFQIVNEITGIPISSSIEESLSMKSVIFSHDNTALLTRSGDRISIKSSIAPIFDANREIIGVVIIFQNVTEARDLAKKLIYQATHDPLTELTNRPEFEQRLQLSIAKFVDDERHALLYLDLDQFKIINDTSGHTAGDALLKQIAMVIRGAVRDSDTVARLGGDEFAIFLPNCDLPQAREIAEKIRKLISDFTFIWAESHYKIGVSIGLIPIVRDGQSAESIMREADIACYTAKDLGRNRIHIYEEGDEELLRRHGEMQWVSLITEAINEDRLLLFGQHIVPLNSNSDIEYYEILIRYIDKSGVIAFPGAFLPAIERYGQAADLDRWVIAAVFENKSIVDYLCKHNNVRININLSGQTLSDPSLFDFVEDLLQKSNLPNRSVCFEITETVAVTNLPAASKFIRSMKLLGCEFSLDDFGSGMSSFAYLKNLPVDFLKIDGGFINDINKNKVNYAMVQAINEIGHVMGIRTIAEFVENREVFSLLKELKVDYAQGYAIHKPCPIEEIFDGKAKHSSNVKGDSQ